MDLVVRASQPSGGYLVRVRGDGACSGLDASSMLIYSGFNYTSMLLQKQVKHRLIIFIEAVYLCVTRACF